MTFRQKWLKFFHDKYYSDEEDFNFKLGFNVGFDFARDIIVITLKNNGYSVSDVIVKLGDEEVEP